jgi:hypothetical protein
MRLQRPAEPIRQDGDAFSHTFTFSNGDLAIPKIDILYAQPETFEQAQTASIEEVGHDSVISLQMGENRASFGSRKDDGKLGRAANALDVDKFELPIERLLVEEEQSAESLVLGGGRNVGINGEMSEECGDLWLAHLVGVAFSVEEDEAANPIDVGLLGADAVMLDPQVPADAIEEFRR